jgi:hypothetical protein
MTTPRRARTRPFQLEWPLNPHQLGHIDKMFRELYQDLGDGAIGDVNIDISQLEGDPLPATLGGTGFASYTVGDILYASTTTALAKLAGVATGNALISGGVATAPSWGKIGLTTHVSGTLPIANGGTNLTTYAQGDILFASATNVLAKLAKDTNATRYLGNTGTSNNPAWAQVSLTNGVSGTLPVANGGTGTATAFTAGSVVFAGASGVYTQDNANLFWDDANNRLGIGTAAPVTRIHVAENGTLIPLFEAANSVVNGVLYLFRHSRGTLSVPASLNADDQVGYYVFQGHDGTGYVTAAEFGANIDGTPATNDMPGRFVFGTTPPGGVNALERMRIHASGGISIGDTTDPGNTNLRVAGSYFTHTATFLMRSTVTFNNGAGAGAGTLTNAPAAGDPTKWIPVDDNGTTRYIPAW